MDLYRFLGTKPVIGGISTSISRESVPINVDWINFTPTNYIWDTPKPRKIKIRETIIKPNIF